jgi:hypothetical protein
MVRGQVGGFLYTTLCDQVCRGQVGGFLYSTLCDQVCRGQVGGFPTNLSPTNLIT